MMRTLLEEAIQRTRTLTVDLNPPVLKDTNLRISLVWLAEQMHQLHDLHVDTGEVANLWVADESTRTLLFQSVRELLFNVAKHAGVKQAHIAMHEQKGFCHIKVRDNGRGFDVSKLRVEDRYQGGFGLNSVEERLEILGGTLRLESSPGQGSVIMLSAPLGTPQG